MRGTGCPLPLELRPALFRLADDRLHRRARVGLDVGRALAMALVAEVRVATRAVLDLRAVRQRDVARDEAEAEAVRRAVGVVAGDAHRGGVEEVGGVLLRRLHLRGLEVQTVHLRVTVRATEARRGGDETADLHARGRVAGERLPARRVRARGRVEVLTADARARRAVADRARARSAVELRVAHRAEVVHAA